MTFAPPIAAIGTIGIEVFGPSPGFAKWGVAVWGEDAWGVSDWQDVTPQSMSASASWGADDGAQGVLSVCSAGTWNVRTYDPDRKLDPSNVSSHLHSVLHPGGKVRVLYRVGAPVVNNGSFESGLSGWAVGGPVATPVDAGASDGTHVALLPGDGVNFTTINQTFDVYQNVVYRFSARALVAGGAVGVMRLDMLDAAGGTVQAGAAQLSITNTSYADAVAYLYIPAGVARVLLHFYMTNGVEPVGRSMRVDNVQVLAATRTVKRGVIDEITYELDTETGSIRATDGVTIMQGANIAAATTGAPTTLRARARWLLDRARITDITVEADPTDGDPTIGPAPTEAASVWEWITTAALDVLRAAWLSPDNVLKFRSFGDPNDLGLAIGGADGIPIDNLTPQSSLAGVVATVTGYDVTAPTVKITQTNETTREFAGTNVYERTRPVPNGALWVANVLADRSGASLQYRLGTLRPRTEAELLSIIDTGMVDIAHISITHRDQGREALLTPIAAAARILGGTIRGDTATGWNATLVTYVTASEWADAEVPPEPPEPPPVLTQTVTRIYVCNKDSRAFLSSAGANLGSGAEGELPVGYWSGSKNRAFLGFATIPWGDVISVVSAELRITTSTQVNIGFGGTPKIRVRRVTANWSEGSASSPSGSNALVYPGPTVTATGEQVDAISRSQGHLEVIPITAIARAWAPVASGGSAAKNYGLALYSYGESSTAYTTEFWAREHSTGTRAEIRLTVKIPA